MLRLRLRNVLGHIAMDAIKYHVRTQVMKASAHIPSCLIRLTSLLSQRWQLCMSSNRRREVQYPVAQPIAHTVACSFFHPKLLFE